MQDIVLFRGYGTTSGMKKMRMHNRSENGHEARVPLCAHHTYNHTLIGKNETTSEEKVMQPTLI
jgi:hypothetical protein